MPDMGLIRGIITLLTLAAFLGICWWAYRPANRSRFDEDAWMAFEESERPPSSSRGLSEETRESA